MMRSVLMPPLILLISREPLVAGRENAYREIEEETARLSAKLGCPHPYLAMESLTGPKEIWWFNGFDSPEGQRQVAETYEKNASFSAALKKNSDRKGPVTGKVIEVVAQYRPDLTSGVPWIPGHGRFLVIGVTKDRPSSAGTVFQAADGTFFVFSPARTRKQADRLAASIPVQQSSWYGPRSVFRQRAWSPPIRDSGEPIRDNGAWERRRPAWLKEASGLWAARTGSCPVRIPSGWRVNRPELAPDRQAPTANCSSAVGP